MMEFEPIVSPLFIWISGIGVFVLFVLQVIRIQRADFSSKRKIIKHTLNGLFLLVFLAFLLNPMRNIEASSEPILLVSSDVAENQIDFWKDSLQVLKAKSISDYQSNSDSLILLGKNFSKEFLYALRAKSVEWIIPNSATEPSFLNWKGVLMQDELQNIQLGLDLKSGTELKVFQAGNELVNYVIDSDCSSFEIGVSASILGRNEWEILVNEDSIGIIRFFVMPKPVLSFQLQAGFPGPELRTLSRYLSGRGEEVQEVIQLSKNTSVLTEIQPLDSVDVFVIDPSQIQDPEIQKQMDRGAALILLNLSEPEKEVNALNKAFDSDFEISALNFTENKKLENGLEALPFEFKEKITQTLLLEKSIAFQQVGNSKIGISLLNGSFSLAQAGDSLAYARIWDQILANLRPEGKINWKVEAPLFQNEFYVLGFNGTDRTALFQLKAKDLSISQYMINLNSRTSEGFASDSAWQELVEGLEAYAYTSEDWSMAYAHQERGRFLSSQSWLSHKSEDNEIQKPIPFWLWGLAFGLLLSMIWLEPKIEI